MRERILIIAIALLLLTGAGIFWYRTTHPLLGPGEYHYTRTLPVLSTEDRALVPNSFMHALMFGTQLDVTDGKSLMVTINNKQFNEYVVWYLSRGTVDFIKQEYLNYMRNTGWTLLPGQQELPVGSVTAMRGNFQQFVAIKPDPYGAQIQVTLISPYSLSSQ